MKNYVLLAATGVVIALGGGSADAQTAPGAPAATTSAPKPLTLMASVLPSADFERSKTFYVNGLGMTAAGGANPNELTLMFPGGGANLMLSRVDPASKTPPRLGRGRITLQVADLKALADRLAAAGFPLQGSIRENARFHVFIGSIEDPDGNWLELIQRGP